MQCVGKSSLEDKKKMIELETNDRTSAPYHIRGDGCGNYLDEPGLLNCSVQFLEAYLYVCISVHYSS